MTTRSERLKGKIELLRPQMQAAGARLWSHPRFPELYPWYLRALHGTIRASNQLLRLGEQVARELSDDPAGEMLADYYAEHAEEEQDHDLWVLQDLEVLGFPNDVVLADVPSPTAAALPGSQYYWIQNYHPIALLGYLAVLERPVDPEYFRNLARKHAIPEAAFRTLILHAELDEGHADHLDALVDRLPLSDNLEAMLGTSALCTAGGTAALFNEVVSSFERHL